MRLINTGRYIMMKRVLVLIVSLTMILSLLCPVSVFAEADVSGDEGIIDGEKKEGKVSDIFDDVTYGSWYVKGLQFAYDNGYLVGTGEKTMSPKLTLSKAMIVTVLYAMSGENVEYSPIFDDVLADKWYSEAFTWAADTGIVFSVPTDDYSRISPYEDVSRQDVACYLYTFAGSNYTDWALDFFTDYQSIDEYAATAVSWCLKNGVFVGDDLGRFNPNASITRAEFASVLMSFSQAVFDSSEYAIMAVTAYSDFSVTNAEGKTLTCTGGYFGGDMEYYDLTLVPQDPVECVFRVDSSESYTLSCRDEFSISVFDGNNYNISVSGNGAQSVQLFSDGDVKITGEDIKFRAYKVLDHYLLETIEFEGEGADEVTIDFRENDFTVSGLTKSLEISAKRSREDDEVDFPMLNSGTVEFRYFDIWILPEIEYHF